MHVVSLWAQLHLSLLIDVPPLVISLSLSCPSLLLSFLLFSVSPPLFFSPFCSSLSLLPLSFSSLFPLFFLSILLCLFFSAALYLSSTFPSLPLLSSPSFPHPSNSHGTRLENCFKSTGHRCYHFNKLQLTLLPKLLTPPPYTCQKTD